MFRGRTLPGFLHGNLRATHSPVRNSRTSNILTHHRIQFDSYTYQYKCDTRERTDQLFVDRCEVHSPPSLAENDRSAPRQKLYPSNRGQFEATRETSALRQSKSVDRSAVLNRPFLCVRRAKQLRRTCPLSSGFARLSIRRFWLPPQRRRGRPLLYSPPQHNH